MLRLLLYLCCNCLGFYIFAEARGDGDGGRRAAVSVDGPCGLHAGTLSIDQTNQCIVLYCIVESSPQPLISFLQRIVHYRVVYRRKESAVTDVLIDQSLLMEFHRAKMRSFFLQSTDLSVIGIVYC